MRWKKLVQFRTRHLLLLLAVAAVLVLPARSAWQWLAARWSPPPTTRVHVPDGGTLLIGGVVIRPQRAKPPRPTQVPPELTGSD